MTVRSRPEPGAVRAFRFVAAGARCQVAVGEGALERLAGALPRIAPGRWLVVSSAPVLAAQGERLRAALARARNLDPDPILVPDGERAKSWTQLGRLLSGMAARGLARDGGIVAFGGGTVGDVAGLAASLSLRGVPVVQVPTTLLAAADSALGGKTAVNLDAGKNLVGTFHHPRFVCVDTLLLDTLSDRDFRSGLAEVAKCALLSARFWRRLPRLVEGLGSREPRPLAEAIASSLRLKASIVARDPDEALGLRHVLNLGHTVAHALEGASGYRLRHGEAVAWGLLAALRLSTVRGRLTEPLSKDADATLRGLLAPPPLSPGVRRGFPKFLPLDKKRDRAGLRDVLLDGPGRPRLARVTEEELAASLPGGDG
ncbi:MAG TPA: 3-dehydroquinate synthase family protein [Thermoanaerobaculia bacterium]|mgnify:CR=1 FL=1|nr:3-dehydroquinate synthase family protein [Thermoanaerobaculia bacterium]